MALMNKNESLPMHVQLFLPILEALRGLGGSATPAELKDKVVELLNITEEELEEKLKNGAFRIDNQITWNKIYLVRGGFLDTSDSEVLRLTKDGLYRNVSDKDVLAIFKKIHSGFVSQRRKKKEGPEAMAFV